MQRETDPPQDDPVITMAGPDNATTGHDLPRLATTGPAVALRLVIVDDRHPGE